MAAYTQALRRLIERLEAQVAWNGLLVDEVGRDVPLHDALGTHGSSQSSLIMTRQLAEFERARFDMRVGVARALRSQGLSNPEIAGVFGVSRQLVHRFLADDAEE
jgi:hypothetical protein